MSRTRILSAFLFLTALGLAAIPAQAQDEVPTAVTDQNRSGDLPFSSVIGSATEHVVINSGNLVVNIPIAHLKGRNGRDFDFGLRYDGRDLVIAERPELVWTFEAHNYVPSNGIWQTNQSTLSYTSYKRTACVTTEGNGTAMGDKGYILQDESGAKHMLAVNYESAECPGGSWNYRNSGPDSSNAGIWGNLSATLAPVLTIMDANGTIFTGGTGNTILTPTGEIVVVEGGYSDSNGNSTNNSPGGDDSLGRQIVTQTNGTNQVVYSVHASDGSSQNYTANYALIPIHTAFGYAQEFSGNRYALTSVVLPNGQSYTFSYDAYGSLTQLVLPTGAVISYAWTNFEPGLGEYRYVSSRSVNVGGVVSTWTFSQSQLTTCPGQFPSCTQITVTDPLSNQSVYYATEGQTTQANIYQGAATGTPLRQYTVHYTINTDNSMLPDTVTTTLETGLVSKVAYTYDTFNYNQSSCPSGDLLCEENGPTVSTVTTSRGNVLESDVYDWGAGSPGPLLRKTVKTYLHDANPAYVTPNIVDKVLTDTVYDGAGNQIAQTQYEYDGAVPIAATGAPQHNDTKYSPSFNTRGNLTKAKRWRNTDGSLVATTYAYDELGNIRSITDPLGHTTAYDYTDSLANGFCAPPSNSQAYVSTVTNALSQQIKVMRFPCTGLVQSHRDPNDLNAARAGTTYLYDVMSRPLQKNTPDGGQVSTAYQDTPPISATSTTKITSTANLVASSFVDGLGRGTQARLTSDPQGTDFTDTSYDLLGRTATVSNPYRTTSDPTYGVTSTTYDALNRPLVVTEPDGSTVVTSYSGNCATATDEAGKSRKSCSDALGRVTQVFEDPGSSPHLNYETDYAYDALGNLLTVNQKGGSTVSGNWRTRTFTYNSLSQLLTAANPESGAITYAYDANGNVITKTSPAPNQTGASTVTTTYAYDALNRLTQKSYSDGVTPAATYVYDSPTAWGISLPNTIGRLATEGSGSTGSIFSYDPMGRTTINHQCTPSVCGTSAWLFSYSYNLAGDMLSATNGVGVTFSYTYDSAARPIGMASSFVDANHPATLATVDPTVGYLPNGEIRKIAYANGLTETEAYNNRLQPCRYNVNSSATALATCADAIPSGNLEDYNYGFNAGTTNNGNIASMTGTGNQAFTRNYGYDALNRLATMTDTATAQPCKGLSWTYDAWGNRTDQTVTAGSCGTFHASVDTNNRLSGAPYTYDAAGNMTHDASHSYTYDAENRLIQVDGGATASYIYDAQGRRVRKTTGSTSMEYLYNLDGNVASEWEISAGFTGWATGYIYLRGSLFAEYENSTTNFVHKDHLGSTRLVTSLAGATTDSMDYLPFGEQIAGGVTSTHKFTSKERDSESGLDEFGARYYSSSMGRFTIPDWAANAVDVPYANFGNPQSLNLYSYVGNNPLAHADPDGHCYPLCTVLAGAVLGAASGAIAEYASEKFHHQDTNWSKIGHAAVGGTIAGAVTGLAGPEAGLAVKVGLGVAGSVAGGADERFLNGEKVVDPGKIAIDATAGAAGGVIDKGLEKILPGASVLKEVSDTGTKQTFVAKTATQLAEDNATRNTVRTTANATVGTAKDAAVKSAVPEPKNENINIKNSNKQN